MQNNYHRTQLLSTTSTRYTVGETKPPPKTMKTKKSTMGKKTKQHRKSKSPKHQRPPDPQVVEESPAEHERAIAINQQRIKNKRNNARSITEFTQPSPKASQLQPEESDLHLDELITDDDQRGVLHNTEWRFPPNQHAQKAAMTELKRKEAQMSQEIEDNVRRNLDTNAFAALASQDYDSSSSHSSATKKQKRVPTPQFNDDQEEIVSLQMDKTLAIQFDDDSFEQMVHNNPNPNLTPGEIETLHEEEAQERNYMAMGKDYRHQKLSAEELAQMQESTDDEDDQSEREENDDCSMQDKETEQQQHDDILLFNNIATAKLTAAKQQHRNLQETKNKRNTPNISTSTSTYAAATRSASATTTQVQNPYITSPKDISLRNRHLGQAIDANCYKNHYTRFQLTFREPPSGLVDVEKFYISIFTKFISILKNKGCKQSVILPFKEINRGQGAISTPQINIDPRLSKLNIFFDGVSKQSWKSKDDEGPSNKYINVLIGHQETVDTILVDTRSKFMESGINFYAKNSQAEEVYVCGWLLYSAYHMNTDEIERKLKYLLKVDVAARFRRFKNAKNMAVFKDMKDFNETLASAMHIECEDRDKAVVLKYLNTLAGSNRADFVTGARVRFIEELPYFQRKDDPQYESTLAQVAAHQYKCNGGNLQFAYIHGLTADVDKKFKYNIMTEGEARQLKVTIRDVLFKIESHQRPLKYPRIFHAIEKTKQGRLVAFFDKGVEQEGRYLCKHLYPYLAHLHSAHNIKKFFAPNHEKQYENAPWDPVSWCVKFPATDNMHMVLQDLEFGDIEVDIPGLNNTNDGGSINTDYASKGMCESDIETIGGQQDDADGEDSDEATTTTLDEINKVCFDLSGMEASQPERTTPKPILKKKKSRTNTRKSAQSSRPQASGADLSPQVIELIRQNITDVDTLAKILAATKGGGPSAKKK